MSARMRGRLKTKITPEALDLFAQRTGCINKVVAGPTTYLHYEHKASNHRVYLTYTETEGFTWMQEHTRYLHEVFDRLFDEKTASAAKQLNRRGSAADMVLGREMKACMFAANLVASGETTMDRIKIDALPDGRFTVEQLLDSETQRDTETVRG